jgi:hypothetical protein
MVDVTNAQHLVAMLQAVRKLLQQEPMFQAMLREDEGLEARLMEGAGGCSALSRQMNLLDGMLVTAQQCT